jgi:hypothetical protein
MIGLVLLKCSTSHQILADGNRMGGPRAWKEQQKRQAEFQNTWDQDEQLNGNDNDNEEDGEKNDAETRDIYAEYDVDPETVNEKGQREKGVGDTGELPGQEDVSLSCFYSKKYGNWLECFADGDL